MRSCRVRDLPNQKADGLERRIAITRRPGLAGSLYASYASLPKVIGTPTGRCLFDVHQGRVFNLWNDQQGFRHNRPRDVLGTPHVRIGANMSMHDIRMVNMNGRRAAF